MKTTEEKRKLRLGYYRDWQDYVKQHPDMPQREQFGHGPFSNLKFRQAKDIWNRKNINVSDYLLKRFDYYFTQKNVEMIAAYKKLLDYYLLNTGNGIDQYKNDHQTAGT